MISTTIETNHNYGVSDAPYILDRYRNFRDINWSKKHVSIEPVIDFQFEVMAEWMSEIQPKIVSMGYDNYNCELPEPDPSEFYELKDRLEEFTDVEVKTRPEELNRFEV